MWILQKKSNAQGYDPKRSRVNDDTMMDFIRGTVTGDITDVPGIGPAAAKKLAMGEGDEKVTNTYQLVGKVSEKKCEPEFVWNEPLVEWLYHVYIISNTLFFLYLPGLFMGGGYNYTFSF